MVKDYVKLIPQIKENNTWRFDFQNKVIITVYEKSRWHKIKEKIKGKEENIEFELDRYGSFVWQQINGENTIEDIINNIVETFEEDRGLATKRAIMFFEMLSMHKLIYMKNI